MVLWEITLGTAYFLGLKRTYKLALKMQRKVISPKHPRPITFIDNGKQRILNHVFQEREHMSIFVGSYHIHTRNVFDMALKVHRTIQERDIEVGRNFGNRILRWLDRLKPEAQIRKSLPPASKSNTNTTKQLNSQGGVPRSTDKKSDRHLFSASRSFLPKTPTIAIMMKPTRPVGHSIQYRPYVSGGLEFFTVNHTRFGPVEVLRNDIRQWSMHH